MSSFCDGCVLFLVSIAITTAEPILTANDPELLYTGRFVLPASPDDPALFSWPLTQVSCAFRGTSIAADLKGATHGKGSVRIMVDGSFTRYIHLPKNIRDTYVLAVGLQDTDHEVAVVKVTEDDQWNGQSGDMKFYSFSLPSGGDFKQAPARYSRKVEIIGDSDITWGHGVDKCKDKAGWTDSGGDSCTEIVKNGWCQDAADYASNGVDAYEACCGCGGGQSSSTTCTTDPMWSDSDGDSCLIVETNDWCENAADFAVDGMSAVEKCCGCTEKCNEAKGWTDIDGDGCAKILELGACSEAAKYAVNGVDANAACCGCKEGWTWTRDCTETWGPQLAYSLGAEVMVEAVGGTGVTDTAYSNILPVLNRVLPFDSKYDWDYTKWTPDAIVILIGPNDNEKSEKFKPAYLSLLSNMATKYSYATVKPKLINVCGGSGNGLDPCNEIQNVLATFNAGRSDGFEAFFTRLTNQRWQKINDNGKKYTGADGHYTRYGAAILVGDILPDIKNFMGWTEPAPARASPSTALITAMSRERPANQIRVRSPSPSPAPPVTVRIVVRFMPAGSRRTKEQVMGDKIWTEAMVYGLKAGMKLQEMGASAKVQIVDLIVLAELLEVEYEIDFPSDYAAEMFISRSEENETWLSDNATATAVNELLPEEQHVSSAELLLAVKVTKCTTKADCGEAADPHCSYECADGQCQRWCEDAGPKTERTCGEIKSAYTASHCCGNPHNPFRMQLRRRLLNGENDILATVQAHLERVRDERGTAAAKMLAQKIEGILTP